jgi:hypothetical protein
MTNKQIIDYKQKSDSGRKGGFSNAKRVKEKITKEYYENPNYCKNCGKIIELIINKKGNTRNTDTKKKIFCSKSCSATYNNKRRDNKPETALKKCFNPECENLTRNPRFCSSYCSSRMLKINKIEKFLKGKLDDDSIRCNTIREYLVSRQGGVCDICKMIPLWNKKSIVFIVDHVDGNYENNLPNNMRAICPNCNSQTETFGGRGIKPLHIEKRPISNINRQRKLHPSVG